MTLFFIVPPLWNDRLTTVERSNHIGGMIVSPGWNGKKAIGFGRTGKDKSPYYPNQFQPNYVTL